MIHPLLEFRLSLLFHRLSQGVQKLRERSTMFIRSQNLSSALILLAETKPCINREDTAKRDEWN